MYIIKNYVIAIEQQGFFILNRTTNKWKYNTVKSPKDILGNYQSFYANDSLLMLGSNDENIIRYKITKDSISASCV